MSKDAAHARHAAVAAPPMPPPPPPLDECEVPNTSFAMMQRQQNKFASCAQIFYYAGNDRSCLTCFIVLQLLDTTAQQQQQQRQQQHANAAERDTRNAIRSDEDDDKNDHATAAAAAAATTTAPAVRMTWTYPHTPAQVRVAYPELTSFALANAGTSHSADRLTYTFVLTDSHGMREYGHVTAFVNGEAVVAVSPYPWCNFFYRLAHLYRCNGDAHGRRLVRALARAATPPSGAEFLTPLSLGVALHRPYDRLCSFIDTSPLSLLDVFAHRTGELLSVLADLLLEKHVIVVGPNFAVVSNVVMSLQALIAPFDWMHILIPILPSSLVDVLAAPPPYLVGMLTSQLPLAARVATDSVVYVRLDDAGVCECVEYVNEVADALPQSGPCSALRIGLALLQLRPPRERTVRDLCSLFLSYYATMFGEVVLRGPRDCVQQMRQQQQSSSPSPSCSHTAAFFAKLLRAQSYNILSEEVNKVLAADNMEWMDNEFIVAAVRSHPELCATHYDCLVREEQQGGGYLAKYGHCFGSRASFTSWTAAVHGFGGHQTSLLRLLGRAVCGCVCRHRDGGGVGGVDDAYMCPPAVAMTSSSSSAATAGSATGARSSSSNNVTRTVVVVADEDDVDNDDSDVHTRYTRSVSRARA